MTEKMRGIVGWGTYTPYHRLDLSTIAAVAGAGGGKGTRSVASYDEDTNTMAVEAARAAMAATPLAAPRSVWFTTVTPAYLDKTNATTIHAALRLDRNVGAYDAIGSVKSAVGALAAALAGGGSALVVASDMRSGLPGSADEATGGDGAVALLVGDGEDGAVLAEFIGRGVATEEFLDRWRVPGENRSRLWEERFGEARYSALAPIAINDGLAASGLVVGDIDHLVVAGTHARANVAVARSAGVRPEAIAASPLAGVGNVGAAQPGLTLAAALERAVPGQVIALVVNADGVEVLLFRTTAALADFVPKRSVVAQLARTGSVSYGKFLSWRGVLPTDPPRRPEPARPSATAVGRALDWKFAFVGSADVSGEVHLPPLVGDVEQRPMAEVRGTIVTFTVDKLSYSVSPPIVFAVVDFDGGGRLPIELTDVDADKVRIGDRVEMTFRKLFSADGIHNYFWKARPAGQDTNDGGEG
jgi:hydroxymethylglutaryl-CoA synthase